MQGRKVDIGGGLVRIEMELTQAESDELEAHIKAGNGPQLGAGAMPTATWGQKCCRCSNGKGFTVTGDPIGAFFACIYHCVVNFSISEGACK